jgi:hypothetical protein
MSNEFEDFKEWLEQRLTTFIDQDRQNQIQRLEDFIREKDKAINDLTYKLAQFETRD